MRVAIVSNDGLYRQNGYGVRGTILYNLISKTEDVDYFVIRTRNEKARKLDYHVEELHVRNFLKIRKRLSNYDLIITEGVIVTFYVNLLGFKNVVYDMHGLSEEECLSKLKGRFYRFFDRYSVKKSKKILFVSNKMKEFISAKYDIDVKSKSRIFQIRPFIQKKDKFSELESNYSIYRKELNLPEDKPVVLYSGSVTFYQNVEMMIDFVKKHKDLCKFVILTKYHEAFKELEGIGDIEIMEADQAMLDKYYIAADYGMIFRTDEPLNRVACPTKMVEYLYYGIVPIVWNEFGDFWDYDIETVHKDDFKNNLAKKGKSENNVKNISWINDYNEDDLVRFLCD